MEIFNVIEVVDNNVVSVRSFDKVNVKEAEKAFDAKARENGFNGDENDIIEDGYFQNDIYTVSLAWSEIV